MGILHWLNDDDRMRPASLSFKYARLKLQFAVAMFCVMLLVMYLAFALTDARHEIRRLTGEIPAATVVRP